MTSEIEYMAKQYRAALDAQDSLAVGQLTQHYLRMEQSVQRDINSLAAEIRRRELSGEIVTEQMLWDMGSYKRTMANLETAVMQYNQDAGGIISAAQKDAGWLGVSQANDIIAASFYGNGLSPVNWERINHEGVEQMIATMNRETPWYGKLYDVYGADVAAMRDAMITDLGRGLSETVMAEHMRDALDIGLNKSLLISETEMGRAYRNGTVQQYQESGVVTGYLRLVKKETACLACLMLDGEHYDVAEQMEDHPRGFCDVIAQIPGVPDPEWEKGSDWIEHQDEDRQREIMGDTRFELWQSGTSLKDMVTFREDPFYGRQPAIESLKNTPGYEAFKNQQKIDNIVRKAEEKDYFVNYSQGKDLSLTDMDKAIADYRNLSENELRRLRVGNGDGELGYLYKMQGFDGTPNVVSQAEFDALESKGEVVKCYRGVSDSMNGTGADFVNQFKYGEHYPGYGIYGNGTYLAQYDGTMNAWDTARSYASYRDENIMTIGVKANAKLINSGELNTVFSNVVYGGDPVSYDKLVGILGSNRMEVSEAIARLNEQFTRIGWGDFYTDHGKLAALLGFDGIYVEDRAYVVLLNRTATVVVK